MAATPTPLSTSNSNAIVAQIVTGKLGAIPLPTSDSTLFQPEVMKGSRRSNSRDKRKINEDELAPKESVPEDLAQAEPLQLAQAGAVTAETAAVTATTASAEATAITVSATEAAEIGAAAAGGGTSSAVVATEASAAAIGADAATAVGVASANSAGTVAATATTAAATTAAAVAGAETAAVTTTAATTAATTTAATTGAAASSAGGVSGGFSGMLAGAGIGMGTAVAGAAAVGIGVGVVASAKEPANAPPVAVDDAFSATEDNAAITYTATQLLGNDTDAEGDARSITSVTSGVGGTAVLNADGTITFTPTANFNGLANFTYTITDGKASDTGQVTINLVAVNDAPTIAAGIVDQNVNEDSAFSFQVPAGTFADVDAGATLTYSATLTGGGTLPAWLAFDAVTRTFSGMPANGDVGTISVRVTASDGTASVFDDFNIVVANTNDAPTIAAGIVDQNVNEDSAFNFIVPVNTFSDVDAGATLTYSATLTDGGTLPTWLAFDAVTRTFSGMPANGDVGTISVRVTASDGTASVFDDFNIVVANTNDAPTVANAVADQNATEDSAFSFQVPAGTFADVDAGASLTYAATLSGGGTLPAWLAFNSATNTFSGTPANGDVGTISVRVTASDGTASVFDDFTITIANVNDAPVAQNDNFNGDEDAPAITGSVLTNDTDVDSTILTTSVGTTTTNGTLTLNADGTFSYTPNANFNGTDSFTYTVSDGALISNTATATITVNAVNDAPINSAPASVSVNEDVNLPVSGISVSDLDATSLQVTLTATQGTLTLSTTGGLNVTAGANGSATLTFTGTTANINTALATLIYRGNLDFNGQDTITVITSDLGATGAGGVKTDTSIIAVTVNPIAEPPRISNNNLTIAEGGTVTITSTNISNVDVDTNTDPLVYTFTVSDVANGKFVLASDSAITFAAKTAITSFTAEQVRAEQIQFIHNGGEAPPSFSTLVTGTDSSTGTPVAIPGASNTPTPATITFSNVNDAATIVLNGAQDTAVTEKSGVLNGTAGDATASGDLNATDPDSSAAFVIQAGVAKTYGTFSIDTAGTWSYTLDDNNAAVQALNSAGANTTLTETVTVATADGTTQLINITINGANDAATIVLNGAQDTAVTEKSGVLNGTAGDATASGDLNATDPDSSAAFVIQAGVAKTYGTFSIDTAGTWSYTLDDNNAAVQALNSAGANTTLTETVTVATADGTTQLVTVTIAGSNDAPVISSVTTDTVATSFAETSGTLSTSGTLTVTDVDLGDTVTAVVTGVSLSGTTGTLVAGDVQNMLTVTAGSIAANAAAPNNLDWTFNSGTQAFNYLVAGESLTLSYTVRATDSNAAFAEQNVAITINGTNDAPVLGDTALNITVAEDAPAPSSAIGSLVSAFTTGISDADAGAVKGIAIVATNETQGTWYYSTNGGTGWTLVGVVDDTQSLLLADNDQTRLYFRPIVADFNGSVSASLSIRAWDQTTGTAATKVSTVANGGATAFSAATDTVSVTVSAVADIANDAATTAEEAPVTISVLDNDTFTGAGDVTAVGVATNGTVTFDTVTDTVTYTPNLNFFGADSFTYTVTSGGVTEIATVSVTVTPIDNDAPVNTVSGARVVNEDTPLTFTGAGNTISVNDVDGNIATTQLTVTNGKLFVTLVDGGAIISAGANNTATLTLSGTQTAINAALASLTYTANADYNGADTLTVLSTDSAVLVVSPTPLTDSDTVAITVSAVADIVADTISTRSDNAVTVNVITGTNGASADNFEDTARTLTAVTQGANGGVVSLDNANGTVTYTPTLNFAGIDTFTYTVTSGGGLTETATVTVNVINAAPILANNTLPVLSPVDGTTIQISSTNFSATDADIIVGNTPTEALTFIVSNVTGGAFVGTGVTTTTVGSVTTYSFTAQSIATPSAAVTFVTSGTIPPTFSTSVSDGIVTTAPAPATSNGPLLVSTTPVDNTNSILGSNHIVLTFNKAVAAGTGNIIITGGTDVRIIPVTDISQVTFAGSVVTINPALDLLSDRAYYVTMESGVIRDTLTTPNAFRGILDTTTLNFLTGPAPTLVSASPADNATAVAVGNNIVLTFSENVVAGVGDIVITNANDSLDTRTITLGGAVDLDGTVTFNSNTVTINPTADLLVDGVYNVTMNPGVIKDVAGNPYAGILNATTLNFNTTSTVAPTLLSSSPADDGLNVAVSSNIVLTFSDAVMAGTGNIVIRDAAGTITNTISVTDTSQVTFSGNIVTINPTNNLALNTGYNVQINGGVIRSTSNLNFAGILNATTLNFTTSNDAPPVVAAGNILVTSTGTGVLAGEVAGEVYVVENTITATWNNLGTNGDGNTDISSVTMDFREFNSGVSAVITAQETAAGSGIWTASYTINNINANLLNDRNVFVTATDIVGNATTTEDNANLSVQDTTAPVIIINTIMGDNILNYLEATTANTLPQPNVENPGNAGLAWSISGTTEVALAGQILNVEINDGVHPAIGGTAIVQADGSWRMLADTDPNLPAQLNTLFDIQFLQPGQMTVVASIADAAGNVGQSNPTIITMDIATPSVVGGSFTTGANASVTLNFNEIMGTPTTAGLTIFKNGTEVLTPGILFGGTTTNLTIATNATLATTDFVKVGYVDADGNWGDAAGNQVPNSQWFIGGNGNNTIDVHALNGSVTVPLAATVYGNAGNDVITGSNTAATANVANPLGDVIFGGLGNDTITGGLGGDTLTGGLGADNFIFNRGDAVAIVGGDKGDFRFTPLMPNGIDMMYERIVDLDTQDTITLNGGLTLAAAGTAGFNDNGLTAQNTFALVRGDDTRGVFFRVDPNGADAMLFFDSSAANGVQLAAVFLEGAGGSFGVSTLNGVNTITILP